MSDVDDHISRLTMMVSANQTKWDLSPNDVIAIRWALGEALAAIEQTSGAAASTRGELTSRPADGADEPGTTSTSENESRQMAPPAAPRDQGQPDGLGYYLSPGGGSEEPGTISDDDAGTFLAAARESVVMCGSCLKTGIMHWTVPEFGGWSCDRIREACAKVCEASEHEADMAGDIVASRTATRIAERIRARGKK